MSSEDIHSVCVCSYHQNVKLLLSSIGIEHLYYEIIDMIFWNQLRRMHGS